MPDSHDPDVREPHFETTLPIVVGAHLAAEVHDRPRAYALRDEIAERLVAPQPLVPIVCSDLWYLNTAPLRTQPTVAIGTPDHNAATAFFAGRVPTAFMVEGSFRIQLDPELLDLRACIWGQGPRKTAAGVEAFIDRYLDAFLEAAEMSAAGS
jgi:hypothetical protein